MLQRAASRGSKSSFEDIESMQDETDLLNLFEKGLSGLEGLEGAVPAGAGGAQRTERGSLPSDLESSTDGDHSASEHDPEDKRGSLTPRNRPDPDKGYYPNPNPKMELLELPHPHPLQAAFPPSIQLHQLHHQNQNQHLLEGGEAMGQQQGANLLLGSHQQGFQGDNHHHHRLGQLGGLQPGHLALPMSSLGGVKSPTPSCSMRTASSFMAMNNPSPLGGSGSGETGHMADGAASSGPGNLGNDQVSNFWVTPTPRGSTGSVTGPSRLSSFGSFGSNSGGGG
ncbi:unnamed protein product, partial [Discosporangium mesarthrocarpum]